MSATATAPDKLKARDLSQMLADSMPSLADTLGLTRAPAYEAKGVLYPLNPWRADRTPGSMYVYLSGAKAGSWADKASGEYGDALDLVACCLYGGKHGGKDAFKWALAWLGINDAPPPAIRARAEEAARARLIREKEAAATAERIRRSAMGIWLGNRTDRNPRPKPGGLCDLYLKGRGIDMPGRLGKLPGCVRETMACKVPDGWLGPHGRSHVPALLLAVYDAAGFAACHRIYLDVTFHGDTPIAATKTTLELITPKRRADGSIIEPKNKSKFVYGDYLGGSIRVWKGPTNKPLGELKTDDPTILTEGFENACAMAVSLVDTDDARRIIASLSLGNMGNVELPDVIRTLTMIGENDGSPEARAQFERAVAMQQDKGRDVWTVWPPPAFNDVNDLLIGKESA